MEKYKAANTIKEIEKFVLGKALEKGIMLFCFTCARMRIFADNGKYTCPICKTKKIIT